MDDHLNDLRRKYLQTSSKLLKFDRVVFKRFAPNVGDVRNEFLALASQFDEAGAYLYSGMCFLGAAKCEKALSNDIMEMNFYLKSARIFVKAKKQTDFLLLRAKDFSAFEAALKSYNLALSKANPDSAIKAAIIREIRQLSPNFEGTSNFVSPCHVIHDLETAANHNIRSGNYLAALGKIVDIFDNIKERKKVSLYQDLLGRLEVTALLLLTALNFTSSRQTPANLKIIEKYVVNHDFEMGGSRCVSYGLSEELELALNDLVASWGSAEDLKDAVEALSGFAVLTKEHKLLLNVIVDDIILKKV